MDDVIVEEGSHIQNSIICSGSHVQVCFMHVTLSMQSVCKSTSLPVMVVLIVPACSEVLQMI